MVAFPIILSSQRITNTVCEKLLNLSLVCVIQEYTTRPFGNRSEGVLEELHHEFFAANLCCRRLSFTDCPNSDKFVTKILRRATVQILSENGPDADESYAVVRFRYTAEYLKDSAQWKSLKYESN
jgi:hypothetical protein